MKIKRIVYKHDNFVDFKGNERPVTFCAVSFVTELKGIDCTEKFLSLGVSVGHENDKDSWSNEIGERIAYNKAVSGKNCPILSTNRSGMISTELVEALLNKEIQYFKKDPGTYIKGYRDAEEAWKKQQEKIKITSDLLGLKAELTNLDLHKLDKSDLTTLADICYAKK